MKALDVVTNRRHEEASWSCGMPGAYTDEPQPIGRRLGRPYAWCAFERLGDVAVQWGVAWRQNRAAREPELTVYGFAVCRPWNVAGIGIWTVPGSAAHLRPVSREAVRVEPPVERFTMARQRMTSPTPRRRMATRSVVGFEPIVVVVGPGVVVVGP